MREKELFSANTDWKIKYESTERCEKVKSNHLGTILVHELSARAISAIRGAAVRPLLEANKQSQITVQWSGMNHGRKTRALENVSRKITFHR
jgi:hypothetical protein